MVTNESNFWSWDKLSYLKTTAVSMIYKCVFPFSLGEYLCRRKAGTRALWEVWLWWKTNCSPFIFLVANEPLFTIQLFFPILLIKDTCLLYTCLIIRCIHQYVRSSLFTLFLCNLKGKNPFQRFSIWQNTLVTELSQEEKPLDLELLLVCYIF